MGQQVAVFVFDVRELCLYVLYLFAEVFAYVKRELLVVEFG